MGKTLLQSMHMPQLLKKRRKSSTTLTPSRLEARIGKIPLSGRYHQPPRRLEDDYIVSEDVLGEGYSGAVRLASGRHSNSGQRFAVKSLELSGVDEVHKEHIISEVENYLCMDHPHITRLYDVYEETTQLHLVMECMEGGELFARVLERKRFSEEDAADAVRQMLLALNYIHSHGIVHRDLKLENFMCDQKGSGHLKLIDFGFSKMWDQSKQNMEQSLGTLAYAAPEVLRGSYTSQCDLWSLGVCAFVLLAGYMPFAGSDQKKMMDIKAGRYPIKEDKWSGISSDARDFVGALLQKNPDVRLTAEQALQHPWIAQRSQDASISMEVGEALRQFAHASTFRRCCLEMASWSLSNEERSKVREYFVQLDTNQRGAISKEELKDALTKKLQMSDDKEVDRIFRALDYNRDKEVHYSDFLAAMVSTQIELHPGLLSETFRRFDTDASGYITPCNLKLVLGNKVEGSRVDAFIREADQNHDGKLSYEEFMQYLCNPDTFVAKSCNAGTIRPSLRSKFECLRAKVFQKDRRQQTLNLVSL